MSTANELPEPTTRTFRGDGGLELAGDVWGPADGPLVVMLHGGGQTRHSWKSAGAKLAANGMRVVALDARGHGDSAWHPDGDYHRVTMARDLVAVIEELGGPATVVGASMGGMTGLEATTIAGPDVIGSLILVDIVPRTETAGVARILDFMGGHRDGFATLDEAADAVAEYLPHRTRPRSPEGLRRNLRRRDDGRWYWHWDPAMLDARDMGEAERRTEDLEDATRGLRIPTLVLRGRMSDVVSDEGLQAFLELAPHAEAVVLPGAAHTAAGDDNDAFTDAVYIFVTDRLPQR
ncbi:MAG TPA: alpha/beta hydrolase [Aldersonia sp.]